MTIQVNCKVDVLQIDDKDVKDKDIIIRSHWNNDSLVVLVVNGKEITVNAENLKKAIENATNFRTYL